MTKAGRTTSKRGHVYAVINPAWPDWIKVGRAHRMSRRLRQYQTATPHRDFSVLYSLKVDDCYAVEEETKRILGGLGFDASGEWFRVRSEQAIGAINTASQLVRKHD